MVFKKRLYCGSTNGFNAPNIPRAPRSCRKRSLCRRADADIQICAFDLLASLAGKLLQERESSSGSTNVFDKSNHFDVSKGVRQERQDNWKELKTQFRDPGISDSKSSTESTLDKGFLNELPFLEKDRILDETSMLGCIPKKEGCGFPSILTGAFMGDLCDVSVNIVTEQHQGKTKDMGSGVSSPGNPCNSKDATEPCIAFPEPINYDGDIKLRSYMEPVLMESITRGRNQAKSGSRKDVNMFRCNNFSNKLKSHRVSTCIRDRRVRKLFSSKHWKAIPKLWRCVSKFASSMFFGKAIKRQILWQTGLVHQDVLGDFYYRIPSHEGFVGFYDLMHLEWFIYEDEALKPQYHKRKKGYGQYRYQHDTVYKKRKLLYRSSVVTSDGGFSGKSFSSSTEKSNAENEGISLHHLKDSYVRFSIKSFKIPELCVEVPDTTTVGSLKSTVSEAVKALFGGGIRVGVLIQGKKISDDNKMLSQNGISLGEDLDLGFTLESGLNPNICSKDPQSFPDATNLLKRSAASPTMDSGIFSSCPDSGALTISDNHTENKLELVPYQSKTLEEPHSASRALVQIPAMNVESLAIIPVNQKPKRSEVAQRRTRRPFSVTEVEALVQAVEAIGTGRWRDVKLRAFEKADHRTYVDLKDKWKTLVHTASISPQQRRGNPVPQELLDRVLAAHSNWSQHQAKQHCKRQSDGASEIMDAPTLQTV